MNDNLKLELQPAFAYKAYLVGKEKTPLIVIDNVVKEPHYPAPFRHLTKTHP